MNKVLFPGVAWLLFLLIPVTFWGFYPSYFSRLFSDLPSVFHIHAFFMVLWIAMAIVQPWLIREKRTALHRRIGKASYIIMPLVFATAWWMIRFTYYKQIRVLGERNGELMSPGEIEATAAAHVAIGIVYLLYLVVYYLLAIVHRKKMLFHATYMFAAILTLLGPTVDRIIYYLTQQLQIPYEGLILNAVFMLNFLLLSWLVVYHWRKRQRLTPSVTALVIYCAGLAVFFFLPGTKIWQIIIRSIM